MKGKTWAETMDGKSRYNHAAAMSAWAGCGDQWLSVFYKETAIDARSKASVHHTYSPDQKK
jgi:hypothetical protein